MTFLAVCCPPKDEGNMSKFNGKMAWVYVQIYFVTIATILGTGVLGLPVTLSDAGLYPFLVTFILSFLMQVLQTIFITDLLQRTHAIQERKMKEENYETVPLNDMDTNLYSEDEDSKEKDVNRNSKRPTKIKEANLYLLGYLFLGPVLRYAFYILILLNLVTYGISYALAGSQAYAQVMNVNFLYVLPVFVWVLSLLVVFAFSLVQPVVSVLTFLKGSLLLGTVIVTFFVGTEIHHEISNVWSYLGAPFLMGTVALGGVVGTMPMMYGKIQHDKNQIRYYRGAVIAAVTTCTVLNILWCWAVLDIVPQKALSCTQEMVSLGYNRSYFYHSPDVKPFCHLNISLQTSKRNGEISTVPLSSVIKQRYPQYDWVAWAVEVFIMISITVSYLVLGATLHHTLTGWVDSVLPEDEAKSLPPSEKISFILRCLYRFYTNYKRKMLSAVVSVVCFAIMYGVAALNPKSFVAVLERAGSLVINLQSAPFLTVMLWNSWRGDNRDLDIPLRLPNWMYHTMYLIPIYFGFAVGYDVYTWINESVIAGSANGTVA